MPLLGIHARRLLAAFIALTLVSSMVFVPVSVSAELTGSTQTVNVALSSGNSLNLFSPSPSNLTLLSVVGAQYDIQRENSVFLVGSQVVVNSVQGEPVGNEIIFTPGNASTYSVELNVSSRGPTYVLIGEGGFSDGSLLKNLTTGGTFDLKIVINVMHSTTLGAGWSFLFGFTGLGLGGVSLNAADAIISLALLSIAFIGVGAKFSRKLFAIGLLLAVAVGTAVLGFLIAGLAFSFYLASFIVIRFYFSLKTKKARTGVSGAS